MRARDVRAIAFCVVTTLAVLAGLTLALHSYLAAIALTVAYDAWLLTRPRMLRVMRRLRGDPDWSGYFDNGGPQRRSEKFSAGAREPAGTASPHRPGAPP